MPSQLPTSFSARLSTATRSRSSGQCPSGKAWVATLSARFADERTGLGLAVFTSEGCHLCQTLSPATPS